MVMIALVRAVRDFIDQHTCSHGGFAPLRRRTGHIVTYIASCRMLTRSLIERLIGGG